MLLEVVTALDHGSEAVVAYSPRLGLRHRLEYKQDLRVWVQLVLLVWVSVAA